MLETGELEDLRIPITHLASTCPETEKFGPMARNPTTAAQVSQFFPHVSGTEESGGILYPRTPGYAHPMRYHPRVSYHGSRNRRREEGGKGGTW